MALMLVGLLVSGAIAALAVAVWVATVGELHPTQGQAPRRDRLAMGAVALIFLLAVALLQAAARWPR